MVTITEYDAFAKDFEKLYLGRGFGSMNKNELEVLFFHLLKKHSKGFASKSNFERACALRISETKIKRLAYEANMSYGALDDAEKEELQTQFLALLSDAKIQNDRGTLRFAVEDKYMRSVIYEDLKQQGYYLDCSFNSEIVSIQKEALVTLLDMYYADDKKKSIVDEYKKARKKAKKSTDEDTTFKHVMGVVFDKCLETGTEKIIEGLGKVDYQQLIRIVSGGVMAIGSLIKIVIGFASVS